MSEYPRIQRYSNHPRTFLEWVYTTHKQSITGSQDTLIIPGLYWIQIVLITYNWIKWFEVDYALEKLSTRKLQHQCLSFISTLYGFRHTCISLRRLQSEEKETLVRADDIWVITEAIRGSSDPEISKPYCLPSTDVAYCRSVNLWDFACICVMWIIVVAWRRYWLPAYRNTIVLHSFSQCRDEECAGRVG